MTTTSRSKTARLAGALYLLVVATGAFVLLYVPSQLDMHGSTTATATSILANQTLFRLQILVGLVSSLLFIALVLSLYRLLEDVGRRAATLMAGLVLLCVPLALLSSACQLTTLALLRGADTLEAFDMSQREALALLLLELDSQGAVVNQIFWGLWLLPLGWLVLRSGFLPRLLGGWLILNGVAYVALSLTSIFSPTHVTTVASIAIPLLIAEIAFALWLAAVGPREQQPRMAEA